MPCLGLQGAAILPDFGEGVKYALCLNQSVSETEGVAQRLALPRPTGTEASGVCREVRVRRTSQIVDQCYRSDLSQAGQTIPSL